MYDLGKFIIDEYMLKTKLNFYGLRLGTVNGFSKNLRDDLMINSMVMSAKRENRVKVFNKDINRPILWIQDLCRAIETIIKNPKKPGIYNLCSFNSSVGQIGKAVSEILSVPIVDQEPDSLNEKMKTKNYNFTIKADKFKETFSFNFNGTLKGIISELSAKNPPNSDSRPGKICKQRIGCIVCEGKIEELLNLGSQPLANNYHMCDKLQEIFPLKLMLCRACDHLQLSHNISPEVLFKNYQYKSGTSLTLRKYFSWLAQKIKGENPSASSVLELACNDGSQLDYFKNMGWKTAGVDPAKNIVEGISSHKIYNMFFSDWTSSQIEGKYDIILAQNVIAHTDNPASFLRGCYNIMDTNTVLYLQTSQSDMIQNQEFDTVYHEHVSFFSVKSMEKLLNMNGLYLQKVEKTNIHGNSLLYTVRKINTGYKAPHFTFDYENYKFKVQTIFEDLINTVSKYRKNGYKVIGYGASAKGNTLLNWTKLKLHYILDDQKSKHSLFTPGMNIEIKPPEHIRLENGKILVVALAWNFLEEISSKLRYLTKDSDLQVEILQYFPKVEVSPLLKTHNLTVISHFYDEEYLLPHWLEYHKSIFDFGIMIDYDSTDKSVELIKRIVPHWQIVKSRNKEFDAQLCDEEVQFYEKTIKDGYKIALNVTEFMQKNIRKVVAVCDSPCLQISVIPALDKPENFGAKIDPDISLPLQRYFGNFDSICRSQRFIHKKDTLTYLLGRHFVHDPSSLLKRSEVTIMYYGFCPANDHMIKRIIQKNPRYSKLDLDQNCAIIRDRDYVMKEMFEMYYKTPLDDLRTKTKFFSFLEKEWILPL